MFLLLLPLWAVYLLGRVLLVQTGNGPGGLKAKVYVTEARLTSMHTNGFSTAGPVTVNDTLNANYVNPSGQSRNDLSDSIPTNQGSWDQTAILGRVNDILGILRNHQPRINWLADTLASQKIGIQ